MDVDDICIRIEVFNRGPDAAPIRVMPHLWYRNTWAWTSPRENKPVIRALSQSQTQGERNRSVPGSGWVQLQSAVKSSGAV